MSIDPHEWADLREDVGFIKAKIENVVEKADDHEERIRFLERFRFAVPSVALLTGIGALAAAAAAWAQH